jgi:hypothetical protein
VNGANGGPQPLCVHGSMYGCTGHPDHDRKPPRERRLPVDRRKRNGRPEHDPVVHLDEHLVRDTLEGRIGQLRRRRPSRGDRQADGSDRDAGDRQGPLRATSRLVFTDSSSVAAGLASSVRPHDMLGPARAGSVPNLPLAVGDARGPVAALERDGRFACSERERTAGVGVVQRAGSVVDEQRRLGQALDAEGAASTNPSGLHRRTVTRRAGLAVRGPRTRRARSHGAGRHVVRRPRARR